MLEGRKAGFVCWLYPSSFPLFFPLAHQRSHIQYYSTKIFMQVRFMQVTWILIPLINSSKKMQAHRNIQFHSCQSKSGQVQRKVFHLKYIKRWRFDFWEGVATMAWQKWSKYVLFFCNKPYQEPFSHSYTDISNSPCIAQSELWNWMCLHGKFNYGCIVCFNIPLGIQRESICAICSKHKQPFWQDHPLAEQSVWAPACWKHHPFASAMGAARSTCTG